MKLHFEAYADTVTRNKYGPSLKDKEGNLNSTQIKAASETTDYTGWEIVMARAIYCIRQSVQLQVVSKLN